LIDIKTAVFTPAFLFYLFMAFIGYSINKHGFHHDAPEKIDAFFVIVVFFQGIVFASPILINFVAKKFNQR